MHTYERITLWVLITLIILWILVTSTRSSSYIGAKISLMELKEFNKAPKFLKDLYNQEFTGKVLPAFFDKVSSIMAGGSPAELANYKNTITASADAFVASIKNKPVGDSVKDAVDRFHAAVPVSNVATATTSTTSAYMIRPYGY